MDVEERIAVACGWVNGPHDGGFAGPDCHGWHHPGGGRPSGLPHYLTDPRTLPEMERLCESRGWDVWVLSHVELSDRRRRARVTSIYKGFLGGGDGSTMQEAMALAIGRALVREAEIDAEEGGGA